VEWVALIAQPVANNLNVLYDVAVLTLKSVVLLVVYPAHVVIAVVCGRGMLTSCTKHWELTFTINASFMTIVVMMLIVHQGIIIIRLLLLRGYT